jgi:hypothetical protein
VGSQSRSRQDRQNKSRQMNKMRTLGVPGDFGPVTDARDEDRLPMLPPAQQVLQDCCLIASLSAPPDRSAAETQEQVVATLQYVDQRQCQQERKKTLAGCRAAR